MHNYNITDTNNKNWTQESFIPVQHVIINPFMYFRSKPKHFRRTFDIIASLTNKYPNAYPPYEMIARRCGVCVRTIARTMDTLREDGLIQTITRFKKPSLYRISPYFHDNRIRAILAPLILAFQFLPVVWLYSHRNIDTLPPQDPWQYEYVMQYNKELLNNTYSLSSYLFNKPVTGTGIDKVSNIQPVRTRVAKTTGNFKRDAFEITKKGQSVMEQVFSPAIQNFNAIELTLWGKIKLCAFPDEAIQYGEDLLKQARYVENPPQWVISACKRWCDQHGQRPNWALVKKMEEDYQMPERAPLYVKKPGRQPVTGNYKNNQKPGPTAVGQNTSNGKAEAGIQNEYFTQEPRVLNQQDLRNLEKTLKSAHAQVLLGKEACVRDNSLLNHKFLAAYERRYAACKSYYERCAALSSLDKPIQLAVEEPRKAYEDMTEKEALTHLHNMAGVVAELNSCDTCKVDKKICPRAYINHFKDALLDLQKQIYSTDGYQAKALGWHLANTMKKLPLPPECVRQDTQTSSKFA